jgi:hypothetical protein
MAQVKYYNTGGGALYFTPIVNGAYTTEEDFGQTENVAFSTEQETLTHDNTEGCTTFEDINILQKVTGTITIDTVEISPDMLTRAYLGTKYVTSVPAGTDVNETISAAVLDTAVSMAVKNIYNVKVKDATDTTTYVEGTDYTISSKAGTVTLLSTGSISAGDEIHVTYDNYAYDDIRIEAFQDAKLEGRLRFEGCSSSGISYVYTFHKVSLLASGDFNLKSPTELQQLSFAGTMLASDLISGDGISKLFKIEGTEITA